MDLSLPLETSPQPFPRVISCSRRTDIPAFYTPWLLNRLRAGHCHTLNPFNRQVMRVSLAPQDCLALVFWTRFPARLLKSLTELDDRGYRYYFNYTLLPYPRLLESHHPDTAVTLRLFKTLSDRISPGRVRWRYDPIVFSNLTPPQYHLDRFAALARQLSGYTTQCTISFVQFYAKASRNFKTLARDHHLKLEPHDQAFQTSFAAQLAQIAESYQIQLQACCNPHLLQPGISQSRCIDPDLLGRMIPESAGSFKSQPSRAGCGCAQSSDIGMYDSCLFGCAYCYATARRSVAWSNYLHHDPLDSLLYRPQSLRGVDLAAQESK